MTAPVRPSLDDIFAAPATRPPLSEIFEERPPQGGGVAAGVVTGLARSALSTLGTLARYNPLTLGGVGSRPVEQRLQQAEEATRAYFKPTGRAGQIGEALGYGAGEIAQAMVPAGAISKAAQLSRAGRMLTSGSRVQRALGTAAVNAPVDIVQGLKAEEGFVLPGQAGAVAENVLLSGAAGALFGGARKAAPAGPGPRAGAEVPPRAFAEPVEEALRAPQGQVRGLLPPARETPLGPAIPLPAKTPERPRARRIPREDASLEALPSEVRRYVRGEPLPAPKGAAPAMRRPLTEGMTEGATLRELERAAEEAAPRLRETELLDRYPDGTLRVTRKDVEAEPFKAGNKGPKNLSDRELDLEVQRGRRALDEMRGALGDWDVASQKIIAAGYGSDADDALSIAGGKARKKTGGRKERLSIGERYWGGRNFNEEVLGAIESTGYETREFLELRNRVIDARKRLPIVERRLNALDAEYTKRGLSVLPEELPPARGLEPPPSVLEELGEGMERQIAAGRRGAVAPELITTAGGGVLGAGIGAATAPEGQPQEAIARGITGGLLGAGAGLAGMRGIRRLEQATAPGAFPDEVPLTPRAVPADGMERAAERIKRPATPTPSNATYLPRTDDEWREFYGRFMTNPDEIAQADALRQAGVVQAQQGTRPVAADKALAQTIGDTFGDLALRDAGRKLSGPELLALRAQREANAARRIALTERLADPELSPTDREWMTSLRARLDDVMIQQFERYTRDVSQTGRDLRLLQEAVKMSDNPTDWVLRAERLAGGKPLNPQQEYELITAVKNKDLAKAARLVNALRATTLWDQGGELWQAGLLTGFARPARDVMSNVLNLTDKQAERAAATVFDRLIGTATGLRTADLSIPQTMRLMNEGARKGGQAALAILRGKGDPETIARVAKRYDMERETMQKLPWLQAYTTFIKRTIGAADALVYDAAISTALGEQARVFARNVAKPGTVEYTEAVQRYLKAPSPEMFGIAAAQAAEVTWQNSTTLGNLALSLRQAQRPEVRFLGKLAVPFVQTPSAMTTQAIKGTPFGLLGTVKDVTELATKTNMPEAQRRLVGRLAKTSVGSAWIYLGYQLAEDDKMTSWYPDDDRERRRWELEGRTESAIKVGGTWVSLLGVLGPQAQLMAVGAALRKMTDDPQWLTQTAVGQLVEGAKTTAAGVGRALVDAPMMQGARTIMDVTQQVARGEPEAIAEAGAKAAQTFVGGMVPQGLQQIARATDITPEGTVRVRQPQVPGEPMETALNAIMQGIPGLRQQVPVRRTALGEERATSVGGLAGVLSPARLSQETSDPVAQELWRTGAAIPRTPQREGESQADYEARQQALGSAVRAAVQEAMQDPQYQAIATMDVEEIREALGQMMQSEGVPLPEAERLRVMSDEDVRRRLQGVILDRVIQAARTQAGAAFPDPRGGRAGTLLQGLTR